MRVNADHTQEQRDDHQRGSCPRQASYGRMGVGWGDDSRSCPSLCVIEIVNFFVNIERYIGSIDPTPAHPCKFESMDMSWISGAESFVFQPVPAPLIGEVNLGSSELLSRIREFASERCFASGLSAAT
jgi:hypothetical protein